MLQKDKHAYVVGLAIKVVDRCTIIPDAILHKKISETHDAVHNYSRQLCNFAALAMEFVDGWREGDADHVQPLPPLIASSQHSIISYPKGMLVV